MKIYDINKIMGLWENNLLKKIKENKGTVVIFGVDKGISDYTVSRTKLIKDKD